MPSVALSPDTIVRTWPATALTGDDEPDGLVHGDVCTRYGRSFVWTRQHLRRRDLDSWRQLGDHDADNVVAVLEPKPGDNVVASLKAAAADVGSAHTKRQRNLCRRFLDKYAQTPEWLDTGSVDRGAEVFLRYFPAAAAALYFLSLVGGFSAPLIVEVLRTTGYLTERKGTATMIRLLETLQMIAACVVDGAAGLAPGNPGWDAVLHVRFLHAKVRTRVTAKQHWDTAAFGVPINQEDLAATLLAFSFNVLHGIELALGRPLSMEEQTDYLHLWRLIGWLIGIDDVTNPCSGSVFEARTVLESIIMHQLDPTDSSRATAHNLLNVPHVNGAKPDFGRRVELARMYIAALPPSVSAALPTTNALFSLLKFFLFACVPSACVDCIVVSAHILIFVIYLY